MLCTGVRTLTFVYARLRSLVVYRDRRADGVLLQVLVQLICKQFLHFHNINNKIDVLERADKVDSEKLI